MKTLQRLCQIAAILLIPVVALGQQNGEEDPFKNDPLFTKPLDSFFKENRSNDPADPPARVRIRYLNDEGLDYDDFLEAGPYNSSPLYGLYPTLPMIHFNRVDGLFLGLRKERMQWYDRGNLLGIPNIRPHGMLGYSFGLKDWQYSLGLEKYLGKKRHVMIGAEIHDATSTDDFWRVGLNETTLTSFAAGYDYLDYYNQQGWGAYVLFRTNRLFEGGVSLNADQHSTLQPQTDWALFGADGRYRPNPPVAFENGAAVDSIDIASISVNASFNPKRLLLSRHFTFSASGSVEFGDPGIAASDYNFTKYSAELISFINFEPGSIFKHRLRAGSITGQAPSVKAFQLGGLGTLRALPYKALPVNSYGDNLMILSNAEMHFGGPDLGRHGWINTDDFYISLFLDSGWTGYSTDQTEQDNPFTGFEEFKFADLEHNGGFGFGSSLIRGEVAWDLRNTSRAPVFWLRFNPTF